MEMTDIHPGDLQRILLGEVPGEFYIELLIRTVVIYFILITSMRIMGKRVAGQISRNELASLVSLAAAIGIPLQSPDRGLLPAVVVAAVIIVISRSVALLITRSPKIERISQGGISVLVADASMDLRAMHQVRISRERLFAQLRSEQVRHLGEVKRLYLEAGGDFTLIREEEPGAGLAVIPASDPAYLGRQEQVRDEYCFHCGCSRNSREERCTQCRHRGPWVKGIR